MFRADRGEKASQAAARCTDSQSVALSPMEGQRPNSIEAIPLWYQRRHREVVAMVLIWVTDIGPGLRFCFSPMSQANQVVEFRNPKTVKRYHDSAIPRAILLSMSRDGSSVFGILDDMCIVAQAMAALVPISQLHKCCEATRGS